MLLVLILGLGGAGAGFYLFYLKPQMDAEAAKANEVPELRLRLLQSQLPLSKPNLRLWIFMSMR